MSGEQNAEDLHILGFGTLQQLYVSLLLSLCFMSFLSVCLLILFPQVELDLKRLRDPLQLQLPVQQLTASKD